MQVADNKIDFIKTLSNRFSRKRKTVAGNLALFTYCMLRSESCNTYEMARHAHEITGKSFDTNEARLHRFLQCKEKLPLKTEKCYCCVLLRVYWTRLYGTTTTEETTTIFLALRQTV